MIFINYIYFSFDIGFLHIVAKRVYMEIEVLSWGDNPRRMPIGIYDMVSHLNFPQPKGPAYSDRNSRGIYAAKFWYIYVHFFLDIYAKDILCPTRISSGPL